MLILITSVELRHASFVSVKNLESPTKTLADFTAEVSFEDLPDEVVQQSKRMILDTIGCALGG